MPRPPNRQSFSTSAKSKRGFALDLEPKNPTKDRQWKKIKLFPRCYHLFYDPFRFEMRLWWSGSVQNTGAAAPRGVPKYKQTAFFKQLTRNTPHHHASQKTNHTKKGRSKKGSPFVKRRLPRVDKIANLAAYLGQPQPCSDAPTQTDPCGSAGYDTPASHLKSS